MRSTLIALATGLLGACAPQISPEPATPVEPTPVVMVLTPEAAAQVAAPEQPVADRVAAEAIYVEWGGAFWSATVLGELRDGRAVIHYEGWGAEWDEVVTPARIRHESADGKLHVEWRGAYWPATILERRGQGALIRYDGYGPEWDEVVTPERVKRLAADRG